MNSDIKKKIKSEKYYSVRQAALSIPWIQCEPTLRKLIDLDISENNNKKFKAIIIKRGKHRRYFIKGKQLLKLIKLQNNE